MSERWFTVREVADRTRLSEPTIRRLIQQCQLEAVRPTQRSIRVSEGALERFVRRAAERATA